MVSSLLWNLAMKDRRVSRFANVQSPIAPRSGVLARWPLGRLSGLQARRRDAARSPDSFVQPFPPTGATYQVPVEIGSAHPVWSRKGDEILAGIAANRDATIPVKTTPRFAFGQPVEFPRGARLAGTVFSRRNEDVMPDGRMLGVIYAGSAQSVNLGTPQIAVVLNWFDELRQRVR